MEKKYFTIHEVAEKFAVAPSLIRFWEKTFEGILRPHKNKNGVRRYTQEDIAQFGYIYTLVKEKGYSLAGARKVIQQRSVTAAISPADIVQRLHQLRSFLVALKEEIHPNANHTSNS
ncbi:MAG: MerR family transcriptional regulator [Amoebophilaceae bacterium]|nr:MerR family transcriptional regulator [Amoebophilaceae bacterium]